MWEYFVMDNTKIRFFYCRILVVHQIYKLGRELGDNRMSKGEIHFVSFTTRLITRTVAKTTLAMLNLDSQKTRDRKKIHPFKILMLLSRDFIYFS
jgi:hypothetical protein